MQLNVYSQKLKITIIYSKLLKLEVRIKKRFAGWPFQSKQ